MLVDNDASTWVVLVVDDDPDNLSVPEQLLGFLGAQVYTAGDGIEGLEILDRVIPTFILLDISMSHMDGWEMLSHIRSNPHTADVPVIALTAHAMPGDKERIIEAGFDSYIAKPFLLHTFLDEIKRCLAEFARP